MAFRSVGTVLKIGSEASAVAVADITEIGGISLSADTIDVTSLDSDGGYKEFLPGFKDAGEVSLSGFFNPITGKGQKELYELFESGETSAFTIEFPPETKAKWAFKGVVTGFETSASLEEAASFSGTIKVSGKPTLTITA